MTFEKVTADSMLQKHPWFGLLENVALPETESDLAWRIPDSYWNSGVPEIEESATKKFKYMANKAAKVVTLALYFAQHVQDKLNDPRVLEILEFGSFDLKLIHVARYGLMSEHKKSLVAQNHFWALVDKKRPQSGHMQFV